MLNAGESPLVINVLPQGQRHSARSPELVDRLDEVWVICSEAGSGSKTSEDFKCDSVDLIAFAQQQQQIVGTPEPLHLKPGVAQEQ
ncbi:hypothetical protein MDA_GLEAN10024787 [Myotis davidii]|uniref:Uncharacterized protein n=1 Tax=Myotis davidii TaxID=225400 RepID=L5LXM7_MYODS|nr:hypothetical protein MDA_GLEAN10024787 [Myotis davidii]